jgi:cation-transporting ATPase 13A1
VIVFFIHRLVRTSDDSGIPCDLLLLRGSCIVNEAMLSGESTPLLKESIELRTPSETLDIDGVDRNSVLFGGTKVLQSTTSAQKDELSPPDQGCLAVVLRTGFGTSQGQLIRTMIFSTETVSANNLESFLFIAFLLVFALAASAYVWVKGKFHLPFFPLFPLFDFHFSDKRLIFAFLLIRCRTRS